MLTKLELNPSDSSELCCFLCYSAFRSFVANNALGKKKNDINCIKKRRKKSNCIQMENFSIKMIVIQVINLVVGFELLFLSLGPWVWFFFLYFLLCFRTKQSHTPTLWWSTFKCQMHNRWFFFSFKLPLAATLLIIYVFYFVYGQLKNSTDSHAHNSNKTTSFSFITTAKTIIVVLWPK